MNKNFSVKFWIKLDQNPAWKDKDSVIDFPSFVVNEGIQIFFSKHESLFKVFVLHPLIGYRKMVTDVEAYIGKDAFVAFTNDESESKLYINGSLVSTVTPTNLGDDLEIGDYVMVKVDKGELKTLNIEGEGVQIIAPAKISAISDETVSLYFFAQNENLDLSKDRLVY